MLWLIWAIRGADALRKAATDHAFFSIRNVARDALRLAGVAEDWGSEEMSSMDSGNPPHASKSVANPAPTVSTCPAVTTRAAMADVPAILFVQGQQQHPQYRSAQSSRRIVGGRRMR